MNPLITSQVYQTTAPQCSTVSSTPKGSLEDREEEPETGSKLLKTRSPGNAWTENELVHAEKPRLLPSLLSIAGVTKSLNSGKVMVHTISE